MIRLHRGADRNGRRGVVAADANTALVRKSVEVTTMRTTFIWDDSGRSVKIVEPKMQRTNMIYDPTGKGALPAKPEADAPVIVSTDDAPPKPPTE